MGGNLTLSSTNSKACPGEIHPTEHVAQFYERDDDLLEMLTGYVGGGLRAGENILIIATPEHLRAVETRLASSGADLVAAILQDRYIALYAQEALTSFMVDHRPDDQRFAEFVNRLMSRARVSERPVRAFDEMAALLWARGDIAATVRLEQLWHQFCLSQAFSLLCAYPKARFTKATSKSFAEICAAHTRDYGTPDGVLDSGIGAALHFTPRVTETPSIPSHELGE